MILDGKVKNSKKELLNVVKKTQTHKSNSFHSFNQR